jgi:hypothetical protein
MGVNFPELPPYTPAHSLNHRPATVLPLRDTTLSLPEAILLVLWPLNVKFSTARHTLLAYGQSKDYRPSSGTEGALPPYAKRRQGP